MPSCSNCSYEWTLNVVTDCPRCNYRAPAELPVEVRRGCGGCLLVAGILNVLFVWGVVEMWGGCGCCDYSGGHFSYVGSTVRPADGSPPAQPKPQPDGTLILARRFPVELGAGLWVRVGDRPEVAWPDNTTKLTLTAPGGRPRVVVTSLAGGVRRTVWAGDVWVNSGGTVEAVIAP